MFCVLFRAVCAIRAVRDVPDVNFENPGVSNRYVCVFFRRMRDTKSYLIL